MIVCTSAIASSSSTILTTKARSIFSVCTGSRAR
jgi:hypothetical protein